jgi:hypothetical protein
MTSDRLVLTNANVIDCVGERPVVGGSVTIERGRIGVPVAELGLARRHHRLHVSFG